MSFTGEYTAFVAKGEDRNPKITDIEKWEDYKNSHDPMADAAKTGTVTEGDYPKNEYKTLAGFKSFEGDGIRGYNISRLAYRYDRDRFVEFLMNLSEFLETPFEFYHAEQEGWPSIDEDIVWRLYEKDREIGGIFKVTVTDEEVKVEKSEIKATEFEEKEVYTFE